MAALPLRKAPPLITVLEDLPTPYRRLVDVAPPQASYHGHSAVYMQGLAGHVSRLLARQVSDGGRNFVWLSKTLHRSEEHTSELQSLMRISYAVFCLKKKN